MKIYQLLELTAHDTPITIYNGYDKIEFNGFVEDIFLKKKEELDFTMLKTVRAIFLDGEKEEIAIFTNE